MAERLSITKIIPPDATRADLETKAAELEGNAQSEPGPIATQLREEANLLRAWITALKSGKWTS